MLILVGDLFEKGEESLGLLRYLMELSQTHTVYPLCGNCDHLDLIFLEGRPGIDEALWPVFRTWDRRSLILQMGAELGLHPQGPEDLPQLRAEILANMPREVAYLRGWPTSYRQGGTFLSTAALTGRRTWSPCPPTAA